MTPTVAGCERHLDVIDRALYSAIQGHLAPDGNPARGRKDAGNALIQWLTERGEFVITNGARCYVPRDTARPLRLDSEEWGVYVYRLTGCNPASIEHRYLVADCNAVALEVELEAGATHRRPFYWASEAFDPQPPTQWVVDRLHSEASVSLVVGPPKSKKTYALMHQAACVAAGEPWLGLPTTQGTVLLIDEESGRSRLNRRLGAILRGTGASRDIPIACTALERFDLRKPGDIAAIDLICADVKPRAIYIDALADVMPGADENAVQDVQPVFLALRGIAERHRAAVVVIHHTNKAGGYRGSSAMPGAVDLLLTIESKAGSSAIDFDVQFSRDVEPFKFAASIDFDAAADIVRLTPADSRERTPALKPSERRVLAYIRKHPGAERQQIAEGAEGVTPGTAKNAIAALVDLGLIRRTNEGGGGVVARYECVPADPWAALQ